MKEKSQIHPQEASDFSSTLRKDKIEARKKLDAAATFRNKG